MDNILTEYLDAFHAQTQKFSIWSSYCCGLHPLWWVEVESSGQSTINGSLSSYRKSLVNRSKESNIEYYDWASNLLHITLLKGSSLLRCLRSTTSWRQRITDLSLCVCRCSAKQTKDIIFYNRLTSVLCSLVGRRIGVQQGVDYYFDYNLNILLWCVSHYNQIIPC